MTQLVTHRDGICAAEAAIDSYRGQVGELATEANSLSDNVDGMQTRVSAMCTELAVGLIPEPTSEHVAAASQELGMMSLPEMLRKMEQNRDVWTEQVAVIEADRRFQNRELLLDSTTGELTNGLKEARTTLQGVREQVASYSGDESLMQLYGDKDKPAPGWFLNLIYILFFVYYFANKRRQEVTDRYGETLTDTFDKYESAIGNVQTMDDVIEDLMWRLSDIDRLITAHTTLNASLDAYEENALEHLRGAVSEYLRSCEAFGEVRLNIRDSAKTIITTLIVLKEKIAYLDKMRRYLSNEISTRETTIHKMSSTKRKWARNRGKRLRGDKSKWLIDVPAMKAAGASKRVRWIHTMHGGVFGFEDYLMYGLLLDSMGYDGFLPFDVFGRCADEHMPYAGFTNEVLPEVGEWREEHGAADYSQIDAANTEIHGEDAADAEAMAAVAEAGGMEDAGYVDGFEDDGGYADDSSEDMTDES